MKQEEEILLVGGAIRDKLLNREIKDKDYLVVGYTQEYFIENGYEKVGEDFPVFLHPVTKDEYALARTERKMGNGYGGFEMTFDPTVSIEEDLFRRDLTINAMAERDSGEIIDPFNGMEDLNNKILRHVSDHFSEDPVRVLRVARFMARYKDLGFKVHEDTMVLMKEMSYSGELNHLTSERVFKELEKVFEEPNPEAFFETLRECEALEVIFPEINDLFGVPQPELHHPEIDTGVHTLMALKQAKIISNGKPSVMYATLLHDLGKGITPADILPQHIGHEKKGVPLVEEVNERLKVPNYFKKLAVLSCEQHTTAHRSLELKHVKVHELFKRFDAYRNQDIFLDFLMVCESDAKGRLYLENREYPQADFLRTCLNAALTVTAQPFLDKGLKGKDIGEAVEAERLSQIFVAKKLAKHNLDKMEQEWKPFLENFNNASDSLILRGFKNLGVQNNTLLLEKLIENFEINNPKILNIAKDINNIDPSVYIEQGLKNIEIGLAIENEKTNILKKHKEKPKSRLKM
jgi:tRNA nucleotidyltransferase (CCA-adding enzyme)